MPTDTVSSSARQLEHLGPFVAARVTRLQVQYALGAGRGTSWATRTLAVLRRMDPDDPGRDPDVYAFLFEEMPTELVGRGDEPSRGEFAAATALHLYALHQQGRGDGMHRPGERWGTGLRRLAHRRGGPEKPDEGVVRRFHRLSLASSRQIRLTELRGLIRMLRAEQILVDYGQLAKDIYLLDSPKNRSSVQLRWARAFHARPIDADDGDGDGAGDDDSSTTHDSNQPE